MTLFGVAGDAGASRERVVEVEDKLDEKLDERHLRTFQRRVRDWRLANGPEKEVFFTQDQSPGKVLATSSAPWSAVA